MNNHPTLWLLTLAVLFHPASAQVPGAIETFTDQQVAATWRVYDYRDGFLRPPVWVAGEDPHIDYGFREGSAFWFVAGTGSSGGKFTGNLSQGVEGVAVDVRIDNLSGLDWLDVLILSTSDGRYYQSQALFDADFDGDGWSTVTVSFGETWYWLNNGVFEPADLSLGALVEVGEIGFRVSPKAGSPAGDRVGCDNFRLVPALTAPEWSVAAPEQGFAFELLPGHAYTVESSTGLLEWVPWAGFTNLTGGGVFSFPAGMDPGTRAYRLVAGPHYQE